MNPAPPVEVTVTYLAMTQRPAARPALPMGAPVALIGAERPPVGYFLYLYGTVGAAYDWTDWFARSPAEQAAFVGDPQVRLWTLLYRGWPGGFFMLDSREPGTVDLAYFGLMPEAIGQGLGRWLLGTAVHMGWDMPGTERMTVNTCTLDHPGALGLYQKMGFEPSRRETELRQPGIRPSPGANEPAGSPVRPPEAAGRD